MSSSKLLSILTQSVLALLALATVTRAQTGSSTATPAAVTGATVASQSNTVESAVSTTSVATCEACIAQPTGPWQLDLRAKKSRRSKPTARGISSAGRLETSQPSKSTLVSKPSVFSSFKAAPPNQEPEPEARQPDAGDAQELAKKLSNPVASLISVPFQLNFDFGMGTGSGWRSTLNIQPVIPIALNRDWNLISRTIVPIIHQSNVVGTTSQNGLGDTAQSFFFSPNKSVPFVWGVGPIILIPTATDSRLGSQKLGIGPNVLVLKQQSGWTYGALVNHVVSVAGKSSRAKLNATFLQPFLSFTTKDAWTYSVNTESTYDWTGKRWAVPIHVSVAKLVRFGKQPVSFQGTLRCWATSPGGGPKGCGIRFSTTLLFPKK
jgi:hypothetical protein